MTNNNMIVDLKAKVDKDKRIFYVGKIKAPITINCKDGVVFLIFVSDKGGEEMQIALMEE